MFSLLPPRLVKTLTSLFCSATTHVLTTMTSSFILSQRKTLKSFTSGTSEPGTSEPQKKGLVKTSVTTSSSSMLFLGTSRLYGIGKKTSLNKFKASSMLREQAKVFHSDSASTHDVIDVGKKALALVYNGMLTDTRFPLK